jgi:hypothetical protein
MALPYSTPSKTMRHPQGYETCPSSTRCAAPGTVIMNGTTAALHTPPGKPAEQQVRFKDQRELPLAAEGMEPPYDIDVRYRRKRDQTQWVGYIVHVSETCDLDEPHLLTHVHTQKRRFMKPCAPVADPIPHLFDLIRPYSIDSQIT